MKKAIETKSCGRCGGTGKNSYNQRNGNTCFKCGGAGKVHTKRGAKAHAFFRESLKVPASELVVGDSYVDHGPQRKIKEISVSKSGELILESAGCAAYMQPTTMVTKCRPKAELNKLMEAALKYQDSI